MPQLSREEGIDAIYATMPPRARRATAAKILDNAQAEWVLILSDEPDAPFEGISLGKDCYAVYREHNKARFRERANARAAEQRIEHFRRVRGQFEGARLALSEARRAGADAHELSVLVGAVENLRQRKHALRESAGL